MTELIQLLWSASLDERQLLSQILDCSEQDPDALAARLRKLSSSFFGWHIGKERLTYYEIVKRVAQQLGVDVRWRSNRNLELAITEKIWKSVWERMSPTQREEFNKKLVETATRSGRCGDLRGVALAGGSLLAANATGFGIYLLASSTLGALTAGLGFALPFGVYMGMSSLLSLILGPVGFLGFGLFAIHKITGPDHQKMAMAVVAVCAIRSRIQAERSSKPRRRLSVVLAVAAGCVLALAGFVWSRFSTPPRPALVSASSSPALNATGAASVVLPPGRTELPFGGALIRIDDPGEMVEDSTATLTIQQAGRPLRTQKPARFIYSSAICGNAAWPNPGDIDGDSSAELVINEYSGGPHCCTTWHVFKARGAEVTEYLTVSNSHVTGCPFEDLDGDGRPEVRVADPVFAYWRAGFAESVIPLLSYRLTSEGLKFAPDLMLKDPPKHLELESWGKEISWSGRTADAPPPELTSRLVSFLEAGHAKLIPALLQFAWPTQVPGQAEYLQSFGKQLRLSEHWNDWDSLNGGLAAVFESVPSVGIAPNAVTSGEEPAK